VVVRSLGYVDMLVVDRAGGWDKEVLEEESSRPVLVCEGRTT